MEEREVRWAVAWLKLAPEAFLALGFTRISRLVVPRGLELLMYGSKQHMYVNYSVLWLRVRGVISLLCS